MTDGTPAPTREIGDDATTEVAERAREVLWTSPGTLLPYAARAAMLVLEPWTWSTEFTLGAAAFLLAASGAKVWQMGSGRGRVSQAGRLLAEYAVLRHVDPGTGRREPADGAAQTFVRRRLVGWLWLVGALALPLVWGQWDQPTWAVTGAVLLGIAAVVQVTAREREARAGRRWRADPPGPPRD